MKQLTVEMTVEMMENFGTPDEAIDAAIVGIEQGIEEGTTPLGMLKSTFGHFICCNIFIDSISLLKTHQYRIELINSF